MNFIKKLFSKTKKKETKKSCKCATCDWEKAGCIPEPKVRTYVDETLAETSEEETVGKVEEQESPRTDNTSQHNEDSVQNMFSQCTSISTALVTEETVKEVVEKDPNVCSVEGCCKPAKKGARKGMCSAHYREYYKANVLPKKPPCCIDGCDERSAVRGMCRRHYEYLNTKGVFKKFPNGAKPEVLTEIYYEYITETKAK